jgi:hypothetical protein
MHRMTIPHHSIEKEVQIDEIINIDYTILYTDLNRRTGEVKLVVKHVEDMRAHPCNLIFSSENLPDNARVMDIITFRPNGSELYQQTKRCAKNGMGTIAFTEIMKDARERNVQLLLAFTPQESCKEFYIKRGLKQIERNGTLTDHFFKKIG